IMGHEIDPSKIKNPHIRRAIKQRGGFLFWYRENKNYCEGGYQPTRWHTEHTESGAYTEQYRHNEHCDANDYR
ncbi:hypothetical protein HN997_01630, partial [archaeon]|nr:hypothetical protein [archaeon]